MTVTADAAVRPASRSLPVACTKRGFTGPIQADDALRAIWRRPRPGKLPVRTYACERCPSWHLTSWSLEKLAGRQAAVAAGASS